NSLHQHLFGQQQTRVGMVVPQRSFLTPWSYFMPQSLQRRLIVLQFEIIDRATTDNSINELKS
ncbi:MAG TPA: hypothetical protein VGC60_14630, partial [Pyrinomonadaceae bacterium]